MGACHPAGGRAAQRGTRPPARPAMGTGLAVGSKRRRPAQITRQPAQPPRGHGTRPAGHTPPTRPATGTGLAVGSMRRRPAHRVGAASPGTDHHAASPAATGGTAAGQRGTRHRLGRPRAPAWRWGRSVGGQRTGSVRRRPARITRQPAQPPRGARQPASGAHATGSAGHGHRPGGGVEASAASAQGRCGVARHGSPGSQPSRHGGHGSRPAGHTPPARPAPGHGTRPAGHRAPARPAPAPAPAWRHARP